MDNSKVSAIILSGGKSSRMGTDKCDLVYGGKTLLNFQIDKIKNIGIKDVIASGYRGKTCDAKVVPDNLMRGPLSGLFLGLKEIENDRAIVISVDVPLVNNEILNRIIEHSYKTDLDIVILRHKGKIEPLIGVYKKVIADKVYEVINEENHCVMKLVEASNHGYFDLDIEEDVFLNVNNKADYDILLKSK